VKLLDFGISRLLEDAAEAEGDDAPSMAQTPAYASPQQARGERPTPLDDIYALGVLLKDLTTGCGGEDDDLKAVAAKASARAAEARYPAVGDLAADVRRWQAGYPVLARPAGRARLALKFWRRHRLPVSLSAAAVAGLIGAVAVTTTLDLQAEAARRQAEQRFAEVHAMSRFMLRDVTDSLERFPGAEQLRHDLADRARGYLEGLSRTPNASRDVRLEAAQGYAKTGEILARSSMQNLGDPVAGKAALTRAEVILRALDAERPGDPDVQLALAKTLLSRAAIASTDDNDKAGALTILGVACPMLDRVIAARPAMTAARLARWDCDLSRGNVLSDEARFAELVALMQATWAREKDVPAGDDPENLRPIYSGMTLNLLGDGLFYLDRKAEGLAWYLRSAQVLETARRTRPDIRVSDRLALTQYNIASGLSDMNRSAEALPWIDRAVEVVNEMRAFEDSPRARHVESIVRLQRAVNLGELHRYAEAIAEGEADVARRRAKAGENPHDYEGRRAYAVGLRPMGELYWSAGRRDQACATWRQTRAEWDRLAAGGGLMGFDRTAEVTFVDKLLRRCAPGA
jgi:tetratricopeptide (TPR) repeat protein